MPDIRVVKGNPSDHDVAALVATLLLVGSGARQPRPHRAPWPRAAAEYLSPRSWTTADGSESVR
ncbi:acyl-CoA carboxylase subunit epsilon [Amycolatopsis keratiniphila]|uniref:Acyl-CoA carboxylase epsilon subunit n=1 Tax=Amycolatopsis keratiniphila subsp. keratiniphila TaxID=227715 RepID=A0A1W2M2X6_9PSEU|nr:hypothetical protein AVR91_0203555 [Amycolatopsis keratiniphila subsp. keratiniphila]